MIVAHLAQKYERELEQIYSVSGVHVIDSSFLNGFVCRRIQRDEVYLGVDEAWALEGAFQRMQRERAIGDDGERYVCYPAPMRDEFNQGIQRLERLCGDPMEAIADRWGGRGGEPQLAMYKLDLPNRRTLRDARDKMNEFIIELKESQRFFELMKSEAYLGDGQRYPKKMSFSAEVAIFEVKPFRAPKPVEYIRHYRKKMSRVGFGSGSSSEIVVKALNSGRPASRNMMNDGKIFDIALSIGQGAPVILHTADSGYEIKHWEYYKKDNSNSCVHVRLDYASPRIAYAPSYSPNRGGIAQAISSQSFL